MGGGGMAWTEDPEGVGHELGIRLPAEDGEDILLQHDHADELEDALVSVCCSVLQRVVECVCMIGEMDSKTFWSWCVAACCSVLPRVVVCGSVLQRIATCCGVF